MCADGVKKPTWQRETDIVTDKDIPYGHSLHSIVFIIYTTSSLQEYQSYGNQLHHVVHIVLVGQLLRFYAQTCRIVSILVHIFFY